MKAAEAQQELKKLEKKIENEMEKQNVLPANPLVRNVQNSTKAKAEKEPAESTALAADSEERLFRCEQEGCTSSFRTRSSLKDHQKVHSEDRYVQKLITPSKYY